MERPSLKYKKHRFVYYVSEKSQRACDLLLKKKFFILRLFLKTLEFEVCYALHLFRIKRRSSKNSTKLT